jgi:hypothetical protein
MWPPKQDKPTAFSEEELCIVSKRDTAAVWAGAKILYSGLHDGTPQQISGYNYASSEVDIEPISISGWGKVRVPELNQLHKIFVFPKSPCVIARCDYLTLNTTNLASSIGGCSGKVALIHYAMSGNCTLFASGIYNSGCIDIIAFGSVY